MGNCESTPEQLHAELDEKEKQRLKKMNHIEVAEKINQTVATLIANQYEYVSLSTIEDGSGMEDGDVIANKIYILAVQLTMLAGSDASCGDSFIKTVKEQVTKIIAFKRKEAADRQNCEALKAKYQLDTTDANVEVIASRIRTIMDDFFIPTSCQWIFLLPMDCRCRKTMVGESVFSSGSIYKFYLVDIGQFQN